MFLLISITFYGVDVPRAHEQAQAAGGGPEDGHERRGGKSRRSVMAPTRVLSRSCEGKLKADTLRRADEEVAISFILSLRPGHVPRPHHDYSVRPGEYKDETGGIVRIASKMNEVESNQTAA
jgi:hypothetical protein